MTDSTEGMKVITQENILSLRLGGILPFVHLQLGHHIRMIIIKIGLCANPGICAKS